MNTQVQTTTPAAFVNPHSRGNKLARLMWRIVDAFATEAVDPLPDALRARHALVALPRALRDVHFPETDAALAAGHRRLARLVDVLPGEVVLRARGEHRQIPVRRQLLHHLLRMALEYTKIFGIPVSSQMLVFSTTSLQLRFISPANPRAIYFSDDVYVGYIPGGRLEVVALDPELGGIFYIFDIPREKGAIRFERSERCMNCHVSDDTGHVPGLVIKSVVPGPGGGSLDAFRGGQSGHGIPFSERFGGWHVTGQHGITNHWGNLTGRMTGGQITTLSNLPGSRFRFEKYPVATSDILPQLLHEHQAGFVNRLLEASYRARTAHPALCAGGL